MIKILDTTLREGEQSPEVFFSVEEKILIAKKLDEFGVDIIEIGSPAVSNKVAEAITKITRLKLRAKTLAHSRPIISEIDQVLKTRTNQIGIFLASSNLHLTNRLRMSKKEALEITVKGISYAKKNGLEVRYTPEDATRTEIDFLLEILNEAKKAGADRIGIADTVGVEQPGNFGRLVKTVVDEIKIPVEVHCHNDFGLALANSLSGIENGAEYVAVTVNGIGERCGITDLIELVMVLSVLQKQELNYQLKMIPELSELIQKLSHLIMAKNKPITGENAFSHKGGLHTDAILKDPQTYEAYDPRIIGKERNILLDRYGGKRALVYKLEKLGIEIDNENLGKILTEVKNLADKNLKIDSQVLLDIAKKYQL